VPGIRVRRRRSRDACRHARARRTGTRASYRSYAHSHPQRAARLWKQRSGRDITSYAGNISDYDFLAGVVAAARPEAIVHFAEQRAAPYSMIDCKDAVFTQVNNVVGALDVLLALRELAPDRHLVKLGTMGEYGTPNIDIEEGISPLSTTGGRMCCPSRNSRARSTTWLNIAVQYRDRIDPSLFLPQVDWRNPHNRRVKASEVFLRQT
jgi:nucleoside-diphosphate-sugar epimerase